MSRTKRFGWPTSIADQVGIERGEYVIRAGDYAAGHTAQLDLRTRLFAGASEEGGDAALRTMSFWKTTCAVRWLPGDSTSANASHGRKGPDGRRTSAIAVFVAGGVILLQVFWTWSKPRPEGLVNVS